MDDEPRGGINPDQLYRPGKVGELEGVGLTTTHNRIARGEYGEVYKDGQRMTLVTGQGILDRRKRNLKLATHGARRGTKGVSKAETPAA